MKSYKYFLNERRTIQVKRKYGQYASTVVGANAPVRQKILGFISEKGSCCKSDLMEFIKSTNEDSGRKTNPQWLKNNAKYLQTFEKDGEVHYKLSKLGQRVVKATTINESIKKGDYVVVNTDNHNDPINDLGISADNVFKVVKVNKDTLLISGAEGDFEVPIDSMIKESDESKVNEGTTPTYKALIKRAKALGIETVDELEDLIADEFEDAEPHISGADFEVAKKQLRLS